MHPIIHPLFYLLLLHLVLDNRTHQRSYNHRWRSSPSNARQTSSARKGIAAHCIAVAFKSPFASASLYTYIISSLARWTWAFIWPALLCASHPLMIMSVCRFHKIPSYTAPSIVASWIAIYGHPFRSATWPAWTAFLVHPSSLNMAMLRSVCLTAYLPPSLPLQSNQRSRDNMAKCAHIEWIDRSDRERYKYEDNASENAFIGALHRRCWSWLNPREDPLCSSMTHTNAHDQTNSISECQ